jgi:hypothetical protein
MIETNEDLKKKILRGLDLTYMKLIQTKKERNLDLVVSKNGKVVHISPKDL